MEKPTTGGTGGARRPRVLWSDTETFSTVPISNGLYAYAEEVEVMLWAYALDDGPVQVWDLTKDPEMPAYLRAILNEEDILVHFHNAQFDRTVIRFALGIDLPIERTRCSMAAALAHSLPGSLSALCDAFRIPVDQAKDKEGRSLVLLFCKPGKAGLRATRETHPERWARFVEYARLDVAAMRAVAHKLPAWNASGSELALWQLDQRINERGICVDLDLATAAVAAVKTVHGELADDTQDLTLGLLKSTTQRDETLRYALEAYGVTLPDLQQSTLERRLSDESLPSDVRELLAMRLLAAGTSTAKYRTLLRSVSPDGRLRGTLQFCGAGRTGRWAGRLFQPQNLPRPTMSPEAIEAGIQDLKEGLLPNNVIELASNALRGCIIASRGHKLVAADLSNIEGRMLAWLAGEQWKLDAFRDFDRGVGPDLYRLAFARSFRVDPADVTDDERQIGKVQELALGYGGGVGAFNTFAMSYGLDLEKMARGADLNPSLYQVATEGHAWARSHRRPMYGLSDHAWIVCEAIKLAWRAAHPAVALFWADLEEAARTACMNNGRTFSVRTLCVRRDGAWLRIRLPSGRWLCYPGARVDERNQVTYMGVDQYTRKWQRIKTYGGKLAENVTQAASRDIIAEAMPRIESAGYPIVTTVHDEVLTEVRDVHHYNAADLAARLATGPAWAKGLPLAAKGFEGYRYGKQ